jgi:glycosyltransferase involved in cell wall biosynthesis
MISPASRISALAAFVLLTAKPPAQSMIVSSFGQIAPISAHDHETGSSSAGRAGYVPGRVLHLVTDALPTTSAGYTIRTHEIALAQRERYGLPVVYEVRGFWEDTWLSHYPDAAERASSEPYQRNRELETQCMLAADLVVTLGEAMRDEIEAHGVPAEKVEIVPNAVSAEFLRPLPDATTLREELGIKPDEPLVGEVTSLVPHEGIGTLLEATAILRARGVPARALIVGDGPERAALQRQAAQAGLAGAAVFTGHVPTAKVRQFHALLDIFVVPRTPDRVCQLVTPLKPVEAMASGLCVVTSEVKALTEIVKHEVTGMQTVPQDPVPLADCLEHLLYSPDIRRKLGDNAREWAARDRTWAHNAARYRDAYARLGAT